ncbi:type II toxin-antitoxin system HicB family antitoxin [Leminorella grimontii]|uniref:type II toxin-antitoxin system HicB family antitoxin n=1 Tax=Leminorella grimontii TaxID=82981 RepID=UPI002087C53E|nr:type II toxin-antitoxin system HicB family antitoxin [Leminorella grimontii]GKX60859.1 antitoxin [Leminorella grimontii]
MRYRFDIERDGSNYMVSFPDIPEALTCGDSREEALEMAHDALIVAFDFYFEDERPVPMPTPIEDDDEWVDVPAGVAIKVLLLNAMLESGTSQAELARRMNTRPQEMQRIVNLNHATKIDTIEKALLALGKRLEVSIV